MDLRWSMGWLVRSLQANSLANAEVLASGKELTVANGGHIVTQQFLDQFMTVTGAGLTLGAVFFMMFLKSRKYQRIRKNFLFYQPFSISMNRLFFHTDRDEPDDGCSFYFRADPLRIDYLFRFIF